MAAESRAPTAMTSRRHQKAPEHKITQSESYLMLDPIYTTIVDDDRPVGMLMVGHRAWMCPMPACAMR